MMDGLPLTLDEEDVGHHPSTYHLAHTFGLKFNLS